MKHIQKIFAVFVAVFITNISFGQSVREMHLTGKFKVSCATEISRDHTIHNCGICQFIVDPNDRSRARITEVEMTFEADSILIRQDGKLSTVPYSNNENTRVVGFTLNKVDYNFRMFLYDDNKIILENRDGSLLTLEKMK